MIGVTLSRHIGFEAGDEVVPEKDIAKLLDR
jgi:hypothetical protein